MTSPRDVVLYGFGRIGRLLARLLIEKTGGGDKYLRLRAIVVRKSSDDDLSQARGAAAPRLVHGPFNGTVARRPVGTTLDHRQRQRHQAHLRRRPRRSTTPRTASTTPS
jgi:glyceraldehyde-3-phosphate dehydrogenase/erythrose-4-phosphate dehydrogenase